MLERAEVGAVWASRYDRLHLHTVRWLSGLPGYAIPRRFGKWPARDRVAEYLALYAAFHELDVRIGVEVERVDREGDGWVVTTPERPDERRPRRDRHGLEQRALHARLAGRGQRSRSSTPPHTATRRHTAGGAFSSSARATRAPRSRSTWPREGRARCCSRCGRRRASCGATRSASRASCSGSRARICRRASPTGSRPGSGGSRSPISSRSGCPLRHVPTPRSSSGG